MLSAPVRIVASACLLLLTSIAISAEPAPKTAAEYWPFQEGNTWTFDTRIGEKKISQVITVTKVTTTDGKTRAQLEYKTNDKVMEIETYEVDAASISRASSGMSGTSKLTPPLPVVQFPLTAGKKWDWKGDVAVTPTTTAQATAQLAASGPEEIKTEAGTFSAMRVTMELEVTAGEQKMKVNTDYWFAPNVGMVKQRATIGKTEIEGVLSSYKLAK